MIDDRDPIDFRERAARELDEAYWAVEAARDDLRRKRLSAFPVAVCAGVAAAAAGFLALAFVLLGGGR